MSEDGRSKNTLFAVLVGVAFIAATSLLVWRQRNGEAFLASYRQTKNVLLCIEMANSNYHELTGRYPNTLDVSLRAAVSDRYRHDASCSTAETRDCILAGYDSWGRPLELVRRKMGNGIVEVTMISYGADGLRQFGTLEASDDLIGFIYIASGDGSSRWGETKGDRGQ